MTTLTEKLHLSTRPRHGAGSIPSDPGMETSEYISEHLEHNELTCSDDEFLVIVDLIDDFNSAEYCIGTKYFWFD